MFRMDRAIGVVVLILAAAAAAMIWVGIALLGPTRKTELHQEHIMN
jgi:hypothetical protein